MARQGISRRRLLKGSGGAALSVSLSGCALLNNASKVEQNESPETDEIPSEPVNVAFVQFTSGPASIVGNAQANTAKLLVDDINENGGLLGEREINATYIDEASGTDQMVNQVRKLSSEDYHAIIGFYSSGDMLAVAPVAEDSKQLLLIAGAGSQQLFDEEITDPTYTFRPYGGHLSVSAVASAQYLEKNLPDVETVAGINQDYAWGHDSQSMFTAALEQLRPDIEVVTERYSELGANDFNSHISALRSAEPDAIFTSHWGGDLTTLMKQADSQGLVDESQFIASTGELILQSIGRDIPEDVVVGARGPWYHGHHESWPKQREFVDAYTERFDEHPTHPSYIMYNAIQSYVAGVEQAHQLAGGWPSQEDVALALEGSAGIQSPTGFVSMPHHQAKSSSLFGRTALPDGEDIATLKDQVLIPADQTNPPAGMTTEEWIQTLGS